MSRLKKIRRKRDPWKHFVKTYLNEDEFDYHLVNVFEKMSKDKVFKTTFIFKTFHFTVVFTFKGFFVYNEYYCLGQLYK